MINIIAQTMPHRIIIGGKSYRVHTDFRIWLKAISVISKYPPDICAALLTPICYIDIPKDASDAFEGIISFLNYDETKSAKKGIKVIDFDIDSSYIFSAFYAQYGIDLSTEKIHYYKFCALLSGLCGEHILLKIINIRSMDLSEIKDTETRKKYAALKKVFSLGYENINPGECIFDIMKGGECIG